MGRGHLSPLLVLFRSQWDSWFWGTGKGALGKAVELHSSLGMGGDSVMLRTGSRGRQGKAGRPGGGSGGGQGQIHA